MYTLLLAIIYLAFISLGLPDSLLGSAWPAIYPDFNVPVSYMGIVSMVISAGTIVSSLLSNKLTNKLGTNIVTAFSVLLTAVALFGFSFANAFWILIIFAIPYGLGAGAIDAALNNYVAMNYSSRHMSWLHCFWGVGTIISPFVMSYALTTTTWNDGYRIVGFVQIGICLLLFFTLPLWKKQKNADTQPTKTVSIASALKIKGVPFLLIGFFAYCAAEATAMSWASTYFTEVKGFTVEKAAQFASLFCIGMTVGRFLSGFVSNKAGDRNMILIGTSILLCGTIMLMLPITNSVFSLIAFCIMGLGCAPIYPSIIHATPDNFGAENSSAVIGIQMASAYIGTTFIPPLFGVLGRLLGFAIMPYYLLIFVILMIVMTEITFKIARKNKQLCAQNSQDSNV